MRTSLLKQIRTSIAILIMMTLLTGVAYPLVVTVIARVAFPRQAGGSLIRANERVVGSELIGQPFSRPEYFWGRPSATGGHPYNAAASSGSNLGPSNPELRSAVANRVATLRAAHPAPRRVPVDLVTASASGLDPHISPAAADYQVDRIAAARRVDRDTVRQLMRRHVEGRQWGLLGEPRVNVLNLNLALDRELPRTSRQESTP